MAGTEDVQLLHHPVRLWIHLNSNRIHLLYTTIVASCMPVLPHHRDGAIALAEIAQTQHQTTDQSSKKCSRALSLACRHQAFIPGTRTSQTKVHLPQPTPTVMAEVAAALWATEEVVSTGVQVGVAAYMVSQPTMPLKGTFRQIATAPDDHTK